MFPRTGRAGHAFTLIEIVVAIVVVALLSVAAFVAFAATTDRTTDQAASLELSSVLREAVVSGAFDGTDNPPTSDDVVVATLDLPYPEQWAVTSAESVEYRLISVSTQPSTTAVAMLTETGSCVFGVATASASKTWVDNTAAECSGASAYAADIATSTPTTQAPPTTAAPTTTTLPPTTAPPYTPVRADFNLTSMCRVDTTTQRMRVRVSAPGAYPWTLTRHGHGVVATGVGNGTTLGVASDTLVNVPWQASNTTYILNIAGFSFTKAVGANPFC